MLAARVGSIVLAACSILLALGAQSLNVSFLVSFAFCIAASANLPVILYTIYWKRFTSTGAIAATITGLVSCLVLGALSPNVWNLEGTAIFVGEALFPLTNPAIITVPLGFLAGYIGSMLSKKEENDDVFDEITVKANTGMGVSDISH